MNPAQVRHVTADILQRDLTLVLPYFCRGAETTAATAPQWHGEEDSAEELEHMSTQTAALTRYRRNHELMNEVFTRSLQLAYHSVQKCLRAIMLGLFPRTRVYSLTSLMETTQPPRPSAPYSAFDKAELENRMVRGCVPPNKDGERVEAYCRNV